MASYFTIYSRKQISVMQYYISCLINKIFILDIYYLEDILYSKYDILFIILDIQNVNIRYLQC